MYEKGKKQFPLKEVVGKREGNDPTWTEKVFSSSLLTSHQDK